MKKSPIALALALVTTVLGAEWARSETCDPGARQEILSSVVNLGQVDLGPCPSDWGCDGDDSCRLHPIGSRLIGTRSLSIYTIYDGCGRALGQRRETQDQVLGCSQ